MPRINLRVLALWAALVLPSVGAAAGGQPAPITFHGEVRRGQVSVHDVRENLAFMLKPAQEGWGWYIWMGDPQQPLDDYVWVATPPYRGVNSRQIFGWHFRDADNTGPNEAGFKNMNAPQRVRQFRFVETPEQFRAAREALAIALWGGGRGKAEIDAATAFLLAGEGWGRGVVEITDLKLGNLAPHQRASIARMAFTVTLTPSYE